MHEISQLLCSTRNINGQGRAGHFLGGWLSPRLGHAGNLALSSQVCLSVAAILRIFPKIPLSPTVLLIRLPFSKPPDTSFCRNCSENNNPLLSPFWFVRLSDIITWERTFIGLHSVSYPESPCSSSAHLCSVFPFVPNGGNT